jgi:hypothetical protein
MLNTVSLTIELRAFQEFACEKFNLRMQEKAITDDGLETQFDARRCIVTNHVTSDHTVLVRNR